MRVRSLAAVAFLAVTTVLAVSDAAEDSRAAGLMATVGGYEHTCALTTSAKVKCWGDNAFGQVGDGTNSDRSLPVDVLGLAGGAQSVATGQYHSCAVQWDGLVLCWGANGFGELGDGNTPLNAVTPQLVLTMPGGQEFADVLSIAAGETGNHTCALTVLRQVWCWGRNDYGQLGDGTNTERSTPVRVEGLSGNVAAIAVGSFHSCAVTASQAVRCWGAHILDNGLAVNWLEPMVIPGLPADVAMVTAGAVHTCAMTKSRTAWCWGRNVAGQLGDGMSEKFHEDPIPVAGLAGNIASIDAGLEHTCAITLDGGVKCWGSNTAGQIGDGTAFGNRPSPTDVTSLTAGAYTISAGGGHNCVSTGSAGIQCWGNNTNGQLGNGSSGGLALQPTMVLGLDTIDSDGDTTPDSADPDSDNDGCANQREVGPEPSGGGRRNPKNFWDFFDVPSGPSQLRNQAVALPDIFEVIARFGATGDPGIDPLSPPPSSGYHSAYDRGPRAGPDPWNLSAANGSIATPDINAVLAQFGHSCA